MASLTASIQFIGRLVDVEIDRPAGSLHPEHGYLYPINYGFVPGELAADGEPLDVYVLGVEAPLARFRGRCIAVVHRLNDDDDKLIVVPDGAEFSDEEIRRMSYFQEQFFVSMIQR